MATGALLLVFVVALCYWSPCYCCVFPDYVQSRDGELRRDWQGHVMRAVHNNAHKFSIITSFYGDHMQTTVHGGSLAKNKPKSFTRKCIVLIGRDKFMTIHQDKNEDPRIRNYVCTQFVKRSANVIQLRSSRMSTVNDASLCDDRELVLDDWPMVNMENIFNSYEECPLKGGFKITVYDKSRGEGLCDAYDGDTRLESECYDGEGMHFRFRNEECVPNGIHMQKHQRVVCMANWKDDSYMYSVLRHDSSEHLWCFRYPKAVKSREITAFAAYLFKDLYCDRRDFPPNWEYVRIDVIRDAPRSIEQLCEDDYEACSYWANPCGVPGSDKFLTCAKRCGICEEYRPSACTIPDQFRGEWLESLGDSKKHLSIDDMFLTVESYTSLRCIQWQKDSHEYMTEETSQMFVTTYQNGCRPRYSCAFLKKKSPSIMRYKLSLSQIWPFENVDPKHIDCSGFQFKDDNVPHRDMYRSKHHKILISETKRVYVDCQFHGPKLFEVIFEDGVLCHGRLTQDGLSSRTKLKLQLDNCPTHQAQQEFACLDSMRHSYLGDQLIVTETLDTRNRICCLMLPMHPELTFYLLHTRDCHEGVSRLISSKRITPLATFRELKPITSPSVMVAVVKMNSGEDDPDGQIASGNKVNIRGQYEVEGNTQPAGSGRRSGATIAVVFNIMMALSCV